MQVQHNVHISSDNIEIWMLLINVAELY